RSEAGRRARERLCLRSPTARPSATRSRRRCGTATTSSSWARTSPRWAARWGSRRGCSTSSAPSGCATARSPRSRSWEPASARRDGRGLLTSAIYDDNPVICFEHRTLYGLKEEVSDEIERIPIGSARVHREGEDVTVIATGRLVHESLQAAAQADDEGISV